MQQRFAGQILREDDDAAAFPSIGEIGLNQFAPYLINRVIARWNDRISGDLKALDMTTVKMRVLAILSVTPSLTINELSVFAVTQQSSMSRTLDSLEEQGFVQRTHRPDDMRIRDISISPQGRAAFEQLWPTMYRAFQQMFDNIDEAEYRHFIAILHRILTNTQKMDG